MRVGISCDHGGFELKEYLILALRNADYEVVDYGAKALNPEDDFPDFVLPMAIKCRVSAPH
jgi:ribose 5-phosphate isomerase B